MIRPERERESERAHEPGTANNTRFFPWATQFKDRALARTRQKRELRRRREVASLEPELKWNILSH